MKKLPAHQCAAMVLALCFAACAELMGVEELQSSPDGSQGTGPENCSDSGALSMDGGCHQHDAMADPPYNSQCEDGADRLPDGGCTPPLGMLPTRPCLDEESCNDLDDDCDDMVDENVKNACGECGDVPMETCNLADDDCDGQTDEGVTNACGMCGGVPEELCNSLDDDCDGMVDESVKNACGGCGDVPEESCNLTDDDCDGETDEGVTNACGTCGSVPVEICNYLDDDCDDVIDENVLNACGQCEAAPREECNGDDDDCDGKTDEGVTNVCGRCGSVPAETCNGVDDDCDGFIDEHSSNDEAPLTVVTMATRDDPETILRPRISSQRDSDEFEVRADESRSEQLGCEGGCATANEQSGMEATLTVPSNASGPYEFCVRQNENTSYSECTNVNPGAEHSFTIWGAKGCCIGSPFCDPDNTDAFLIRVRGVAGCSFSTYRLLIETKERCEP